MSLKQEVDSKRQWAQDNPSLCMFPWSMFDIRRSIVDPNVPNITCCCNLDERKLVGVKDPLAEVRRQMDAGVLPDACYRCATEEQAGGTSERIRRILSETDDNLARFVEERYVRNYGIRVKFSNRCIQACRSCHPHDSNLWRKLAADTTPDRFADDIADDPEFWDLITSSIQQEIDLHDEFHIDLMGGETVLQDGTLKLLDWICDQGYNDRMEVRLTTSLSVLPERVLERLVKFRSVLFMLSIDTVGDNYRYVRWPVEFGKVEQNMTVLLDYLANHNTRHIILITPVFSLNNIFYIRDFLDYWNTWFKNNRSYMIMNTNITVPTAYLDFQALPIRYRGQLRDLLTECLSHEIFQNYGKDTIYVYNFLQSTIQELDTWPENDMLWDLFLKFTAEFDTRTKTKFDELNSRLYNILNDQDRSRFAEHLAQADPNKILRSKAYLLKIHGLPY